MNIKNKNELKGMTQYKIEVPSEEFEKYKNRARLILSSDLLESYNFPLDSNIEPIFDNSLDNIAFTTIIDKIGDFIKENENNSEDIIYVSEIVSSENVNGNEIIVNAYIKPEITIDYKNLEKAEPFPGLSEEEKSKFIEDKLTELQKTNARLTPYDGAYEEGKAISFSIKSNSEIGGRIDNKIQFPEDIKERSLMFSALEGKSAGEDITPESLNDETVITLNQVYDIEYDDLDDEFASEVSEFDTLDELKNSLLEKEEQEAKSKYESKQLEEKLKKFIKSVTVENVEPHLAEYIENLKDTIEINIYPTMVDLLGENYNQLTEEGEYNANLYGYIFEQIAEDRDLVSEEDIDKVLNGSADEVLDQSYAEYLTSYVDRNRNESEDKVKESIRRALSLKKAYDFIENSILDSEK